MCLAAIRAADDPPEELIVVDEPAWSGPAAARNVGAVAAEGDVLVFIDADVEVHADALTRIRAAFESDPELTALFGAYDSRVAAPGLVSAFRNLLHHHVHSSSPGPALTFWAGLGAVRRQAFDAVGGFDADRYTRPSIEDIELGMRLASAGARIVLDPNVQGTHLKRWTLREMVRTDFARRGVPWVALLLRRPGDRSVLNLGWRHRLSAAAALALVAGGASRRPRLAAGAVVALIGLNAPFYALLVRRVGPAGAVGGIALHALHHLVAVAAVPAGVLRHLQERDG